MTNAGSLFRSSIGKKILMALTGIVLLGFVIGHLLGNLQIFQPPEKMNQYAHFLATLGPALWAVRIFLLACVVLHVWLAIDLTVKNRAARPGRYGSERTLRASLASRTMRISGFIVLAFLIFHLAHYTFRITHPQYNELTYTLQSGAGAGTAVRDVHAMVVAGFGNLWISLFYLFAIGLLSYHLSHGIGSSCQTLGLRNGRWARGLRTFGVLFSWAYFLGNAAIPLGVLTGWVSRG